MYWTFKSNNDGKRYASWGSPRLLKESEVSDLQARFDVPIYDGRRIAPHESVVMMMQGDGTLGLGDSIWLISFMRDIYRHKARRRCRFVFCSSDWVLKFYSHFLPRSFELVREYMTESDFMAVSHKLPAMYYWREKDKADRSWVDNRSLLERLYNWTGMRYEGLPDWGEFTDEEILYPAGSFWSGLGLDRRDKYVYFQWHSTGPSKNLSPKANMKIIQHIVRKYGYKVYVVGRLKSLEALNSIPGVVSLSGRTEGHAEALFALAFNSEFIVSPDSAGVHLSEAYRVPSVCIMSSLPPVYICSKYRIPAFMYGSGFCPHKPCGVVHHLPKQDMCPEGTGDYCRVFDDIDLALFDKCLEQSARNVDAVSRARTVPFYDALSQPISLVNP